MLDIQKEAKILIIFSLFCSFGVSVVFPYIPIFGKEIGMPVILIGNLVVLYYLLQALTRIPLGKLSDLIGHDRPIFIGALIYFSSGVSFLLSMMFWPMLFIGEMLLGIANSVTWVTIPSYITEAKNALPTFTFTVALGWLIGSPVGGYIKDNSGMSMVFLTLFFVSLVLIYLSWLFYSEANAQTKRTSVRDFIKMANVSPSSLPIYPSFRSYLDAWELFKTNQHILFASLFSFVVFMTFGLGASIVPLYFSEVGISSFFIGILVSIRLATNTFIKLCCNYFTKRFGNYKVLIVSTVIAGMFVSFLALSESFVLIAIFSALWGFGSGLYLPIVFKIIGDHSTKEERGVAMGIRGTLGTFGAAFGTWMFSSIAASLSLSSSLLIAGFFAIICSLLLGVLSKS